MKKRGREALLIPGGCGQLLDDGGCGLVAFPTRRTVGNMVARPFRQRAVRIKAERDDSLANPASDHKKPLIPSRISMPRPRLVRTLDKLLRARCSRTFM